MLLMKKSARAIVFALFFSCLTLIPQYSGNSAATLSTTNLILNVDGTSTSSYSGSGSTWTDLSTAGNDLTIGSGCGYTTGPSWSSTEGGGSFLFNTDKQCVRRATMSSAPQNFSFFFWIKPTSMPSAGTYSYLAQIGRDSGQSNFEYMFGYNSSGQLYFWDYAGGYGYSNVTSNISSTLVTTNVWQYVGFVKNGTNPAEHFGTGSEY